MSTPKAKGKFGLLDGLNNGTTPNLQNVLTVKQQDVNPAVGQHTTATPAPALAPQDINAENTEERYSRFSNYLRPDLYDRLHRYVAAHKRSGVKLITAFNEAIEEYLSRRDS